MTQRFSLVVVEPPPIPPHPHANHCSLIDDSAFPSGQPESDFSPIVLLVISLDGMQMWREVYRVRGGNAIDWR